MGVGNFLPGGRYGGPEDYAMVYVDRDDYDDAYKDGEYDVDRGQENFEDFVDSLRAALPPSFDAPWRQRWEHDLYIVAENELGAVGVKEWETYAAVTVYPHENAPAFAWHQLSGVADRLFDTLADWYRLHIRTSAYTSAPYHKTTELCTGA